MAYDTDKKKYSNNTMDYNPNAGENTMHFVGNSEGGRTEGIIDKAGVEYGLGMIEGIDVKNAEMVCQNQRPKGRRESASGAFTIGT